jgi:D-glycero-D-manno-heptose 1,7-bisphosphate phosphatase
MSDRRNPAVFLDRDGTIIYQVELLHDAKQLRLLPHTAEAIRLFNEASLSVIVVTNQPVVARGISSPDDVSNIHRLLSKRLARHSAHIDAFYLCPHHPNATIEQYRQICECRKPNPGMILRAAADHNLDIRNSVMIGDTTQDVLAGHRAGVSTILVNTGHGGRDPWQYDSPPDFKAPSLLAAAHLWLARVRQ